MKKRIISLLLALCVCAGFALPAAAADDSVRQIEGGHLFTFLVTEDGTLYGCGYNSNGVLGPDVVTTNDGAVWNVVTTPQKIAEGVAEVAACVDNVQNFDNHSSVEHGDHCLILMENGDLYTQGDNFYGQLGVGDKETRKGMQFVMDDVAAIAAGDYFSACVTEDGSLYWWGLVVEQGGGTVRYSQTAAPQKVGSGFVALDAGSGHIVALHEDGSVWTMGSKTYGACGDGLLSGVDRELTKVFEGAVAVAAGSNHTLVLTEDGDVYGWGCNDSYQLGQYIPPEEYHTAESRFAAPVYVMGDAKAVEAGFNNSYVIKTNGDLWAFGTSFDGQLGLGYLDYSGAPIKTAENVKAVSSGYKNAFILTEDGSTYAAGHNYYYTFGDGVRMLQVPGWAPALLTASPIREAGTMQFTDVKAGDYFYEPVQWAVDQGITNGTTATTFSPDALCNRAQIITFLWRAAGSETPITVNQFRDVDRNAYYFTALRWAQEYPFGAPICPNYYEAEPKFRPNDDCTRAMAVEFMWKAAGSPWYDTSALPFSDVSAGASYAQAVAWALDCGVTTGTSATTFSPNATCTRAQIATFLYRAFA